MSIQKKSLRDRRERSQNTFVLVTRREGEEAKCKKVSKKTLVAQNGEGESEELKGKRRIDKGAKKPRRAGQHGSTRIAIPQRKKLNQNPRNKCGKRKKIESSPSHPREVEVTLATAQGHRLGAQISKEKGVLNGGDLIKR